MCIRDREGTWQRPTCNIGFNPRAWEVMFNEVPSDALGLESVSYTHLDVYKRQILYNGGTATFITSLLKASVLPAISILLLGTGWWIISMKSL